MRLRGDLSGAHAWRETKKNTQGEIERERVSDSDVITTPGGHYPARNLLSLTADCVLYS